MPTKQAIEEFKSGQGTVGLSAQALGNAQELTKSVVVKAHLDNTDNVFVGPSGLTVGTGFLLDAGEATPPIEIDDLGKVFVIADAVSQGYSWLAM